MGLSVSIMNDSFDKAWRVVKTEPYRVGGMRLKPGERMNPPPDNRIFGYTRGIPDFEEKWYDLDTCACNGTDEEDLPPHIFPRDAKWMKDGPTYDPDCNLIYANCGHCGEEAEYHLDSRDWRTGV